MDYKISTIDYFSPSLDNLYQGIVELTNSINDTYPKHNDWLYKKFFPGLKDGSRKIVVAYEDLNKPMGVALLKDTKEEKKICCLFVRDDCRKKGIAKKLVEQSFEALGTKIPLMTVSDRNIEQLQRIVNIYNFKFSYRKKGAYQKESTEIYFNNEATELLKTNILSPLFSKVLQDKKNRTK